MPITAEPHWPEFMRNQASHVRLTYPKTFRSDDLQLRYRIERRDVLFEDKEDDLRRLIYLKSGFGWIYRKDQIIGALEFTAIHGDGVLDHEFWWAVDGVSQDLGEIADAANQCWENYTWPPDFGPILYLEHLWIEPAHRNFTIPVRELENLFGLLAPKYSVVAFVASPDSHRVVSANVVNLRTDNAHRLALMELYRRKYGFAAFPAAYGESGMMWRIRPELVGVVRRPGIIAEHWSDR